FHTFQHERRDSSTLLFVDVVPAFHRLRADRVVANLAIARALGFREPLRRDLLADRDPKLAVELALLAAGVEAFAHSIASKSVGLEGDRGSSSCTRFVPEDSLTTNGASAAARSALFLPGMSFSTSAGLFSSGFVSASPVSTPA